MQFVKFIQFRKWNKDSRLSPSSSPRFSLSPEKVNHPIFCLIINFPLWLCMPSHKNIINTHDKNGEWILFTERRVVIFIIIFPHQRSKKDLLNYAKKKTQFRTFPVIAIDRPYPPPGWFADQSALPTSWLPLVRWNDDDWGTATCWPSTLQVNLNGPGSRNLRQQ